MRPQGWSLGGGELLPLAGQEGAQEEGHLGWVPEGSRCGGRMGVVFTVPRLPGKAPAGSLGLGAVSGKRASLKTNERPEKRTKYTQ